MVWDDRAHCCRTVCRSSWGHLPQAGVLQDTHDPLNPVHCHTLLKTAEPWKSRKLYYELHELCWQQGWVCGADGLCETCVCVRIREQTPCLCGQEVLGHTRFAFDKDPKLSSFRAGLNMVLLSRDTYNAYLTTQKQQLLFWKLLYSMFSLVSTEELIFKEVWSVTFCVQLVKNNI